MRRGFIDGLVQTQEVQDAKEERWFACRFWYLYNHRTSAFLCLLAGYCTSGSGGSRGRSATSSKGRFDPTAYIRERQEKQRKIDTRRKMHASGHESSRKGFAGLAPVLGNHQNKRCVVIVDSRMSCKSENSSSRASTRRSHPVSRDNSLHKSPSTSKPSAKKTREGTAHDH